MSEAIVLSEIRALSKELALAQTIPQALKNKPADILAVVLTGKELGIEPMTSLRGFDVISGKVAMSSQMIGALILSSPACEYLTPIEFTGEIATYETKRRGSPAPVRMSYTIEDARLAGLTSKDNYKKNPTAMLLARAQARIGRAVYPDKCLGIYDRDSGELDDVEPPKQDAQREHIEKVKTDLRSQIVDGEVVKSESIKSEPIGNRIQTAPTVDALTALLPDIQTFLKSYPDERANLLAAYSTRKTELEAK